MVTPEQPTSAQVTTLQSRRRRSAVDGRSKTDRFSFTLTGDLLAVARRLADRHDVGVGEVLRRALSFLAFVDEEEQKGTVFRIQDSGKSIQDSERIRIRYI